MWPDRVSNPGPLTYESDALPTSLRGPTNFLSLVCVCVCAWGMSMGGWVWVGKEGLRKEIFDI